MSRRTLSGNSFSNTVFVNTLSGGSALSITTANNSTSSTIDLKISKQDTQATFEDDDLIVIENASGNIKKVLGSVVKDSADGFFTKVSSNIYPDATSENLLLGTTSNSNSRKLLVVGDGEIQGDLYLQLDKKIISSNNSDDYLQFGNRTFTNNYLSNIFTYGVSFGATADLNLSTGRAITRQTDTNDKITFNSGNFTFGNTGIFDNSVYVKSTEQTNSGFVSFYEASNNGQNNIDLHSPLNLTHDYNVYLPQNTDTSLLNVYILSNKNVLPGTNINITNSTTDTITVNMDTTINGTITFSSTISGSISGNAGTATKIASITNSNIVQLTASQVLTNKTLTSPTITGSGAIAGIFTGNLTGNADTSTKIASITNSNIVQLTNSQVLTNKSFNDLTVFEEGLAVKQSATNTSGKVRFYDKDNSNYIDLHIEDHAVLGNYNMYLPNDIEDTVLVGTRNTQNLINKTLSTGTTYNGNTIAVNYGGTGQPSYLIGDLLYASAVATLSRLTIGSNNSVLMSNGTNPVYRTFTEGTNITISHSSSAITISSSENYWENANTIGVLDIQPTSSVNDIDLDAINLLVIPKTVNVIPTGLASGKVIQYDSGLGGGNGSMVFGDNGSSATVNWDTGIYAKQFINMKCGTDTLLQLNNTPASVASATFTLNDINIDLGTNNGYSNISYGSSEPLMLYNKATTGAVHSHLVMKRDSAQSDYIILKQNDSDELLFHHENSGDDFVVGKAFEYGNKGAKWKYTDPYTYLYNPEDTSGASSLSGSIMTFHKNGSVVFFNTTSTYSSGDTNYFSFAKSNDQEARITMNGIAQISDEWLDESDPSDIRLKYDIKDYGNATEVINKIKIKSFMKYRIKNFNNDEEGNMLPFKDRLGESRYSIGVIAQELYEIPELSFMVRQNDFNDITPAYIHDWKPIISLLVKSNQEQQETINTLTNLVNEMKATIDKLNSSTSFKDFKSK